MNIASNNWLSTTSGEICEFITSGSRDWKSYYSEHGPLFVRTQDINQDRLDLSQVAHVNLPEKVEGKRSRIEPGDLLVTITGANVGKVALVPDDIPEAYVSQSVGLMRLKDKRNGHYLHYYLQSDRTGRKQVLDMVYGIGRPVLSLQNLRDIPVSLPPLDEQHRIVAEIEKQFTRLDAGVAALRRVQANLKRYRAAVLKAACEGHLVPTEAELHRQFKTKSNKLETGSELLARVRKIKYDKIRKGELRKQRTVDTAFLETTDSSPSFPDGWAWGRVEDFGIANDNAIVDGPFGSNLKLSDYIPDGKYPVITITNIDQGFDLNTLRKVSEAKFEEVRRSAVRAGDILVAKIGSSFGKTGIYPPHMPAGIIPANLLKITPTAEMNWKYLFYHLHSLNFKKHLDMIVQYTAQPAFNVSKFKLLPVPIPPLAEQRRIVAEVERLLSVVGELENVVSGNLQRASRLRQSILQKAFAGELVAPIPAIRLADIVPPLKPKHIHQPNPHFARALLSAEIVHQLHKEPTFGRIKHQKIFHLCEHIAQIEEIQGQYHREAAGPLDNKLIYANLAELKKQKWYQEVPRESHGHAYQSLDKAGGHRKYVERYWPDKLKTIEKLIKLMRTWDTDTSEIFCTVYAAWNDLILWGKQATEDNILHEILERWHESKKRFPKERWLKVIAWMKKEGFVPTGFGKPTKVAQ